MAWGAWFLLTASLPDLACPITNVCNRTGQIGQINNQSYSGTLLLTQLTMKEPCRDGSQIQMVIAWRRVQELTKKVSELHTGIEAMTSVMPAGCSNNWDKGRLVAFRGSSSHKVSRQHCRLNNVKYFYLKDGMVFKAPVRELCNWWSHGNGGRNL